MIEASGNEHTKATFYDMQAGDIEGLDHKQNVALRKFVYEMREKLRKNAHKGSWQGDHPLEMLGRLMEECGEMAAEINAKMQVWNFEKITAECADIANFAMMIQDCARRFHDRTQP